ncbi:MAG: hypothetical protein MJ211_10670 [Bacteroidales bacterium]|nr:hypothetical protein [Bacteroidales bacterium]
MTRKERLESQGIKLVDDTNINWNNLTDARAIAISNIITSNKVATKTTSSDVAKAVECIIAEKINYVNQKSESKDTVPLTHEEDVILKDMSSYLTVLKNQFDCTIKKLILEKVDVTELTDCLNELKSLSLAKLNKSGKISHIDVIKEKLEYPSEEIYKKTDCVNVKSHLIEQISKFKSTKAYKDFKRSQNMGKNNVKKNILVDAILNYISALNSSQVNNKGIDNAKVESINSELDIIRASIKRTKTRNSKDNGQNSK